MLPGTRRLFINTIEVKEAFNNGSLNIEMDTSSLVLKLEFAQPLYTKYNSDVRPERVTTTERVQVFTFLFSDEQ